LKWRTGILKTCIAGESSLIKKLRHYLMIEKRVPKQDAYISGYWKIGLIEDEHRAWKNSQTS
jgi:NADPH-dependent ferric siderophore reductase